MSLSIRQQQQLQKIIKLVEKFKAEAEKTSSAKHSTRIRRSKADTEKMRRDVIAARAKGIAAAKLAEKYGVSVAYIYMIKG